MADSTSTIIAQCTPSGAGALALLRLSGPHAWSIADKMAPATKILERPSHTIHFAKLLAKDNSVIDQIMIMIMRAPRSFTGEDTIEITCHNNQFLIQEIINRALELGAQPAAPGEFTQRAFNNGKIDLLQAEAIHDLITAQSQLALKKSLAQLEGSFSYWVEQLEIELLRALAWCEASFEFLDEEQEFGQEIMQHLNSQQEFITRLQKHFNQKQHIKQGIRIALIGSVNAGKSSLFNTLIGQKRAIVNAQAGTTRDSIEAQLAKNDIFWTLVDTAGLRNTEDSIEQEGIARSREEAHKADIILLIIDSSRILIKLEQELYEQIFALYTEKILVVLNKSDLVNVQNFLPIKGISVSSLEKTGLENLENHINAKIITLMESHNAPFLLNKRHYELLSALSHQLSQIIHKLEQPTINYEIISYHLRESLEHLSSLTGKSISEAGLDMVFKEFCVGK